MTDARQTPLPPDIDRRTLTPFGYAVCIAVPVLIAAIGFAILYVGYDKDDLVDGRRVPILTSDRQPGDGSNDALLSGEITFADDGCVRVGDEVVVWPADYVATVQRVGPSDQLRIYDPDRDVVARSGDAIEVGGGYSDAGAYAGRTCAPASGDLFFVQSGVTVVPAP